MKHLHWKLKQRFRHLLLKFSPIFKPGENADEWETLRYEPVYYSLTAELTFALTGDDIEEILCLAIRRGITYWCTEVSPVESLPTNLFSHHGALSLRDNNGNIHQLTISKFIEGFRLYLIDNGNVARSEAGRINARNIDAYAANLIVQYALFGKIIYE